MTTILVTGGAGFIGSHLIDKLLIDGYTVFNIDNLDAFYDTALKLKNIERHSKYNNYTFIQQDIRNIKLPENAPKFDIIIHLAAKAGVRPSLKDPVEYFDVNINGTLNLLEFAKENGIRKFIFASSSSVYGINPQVPWSEDILDLNPISPYASSKLAAEKIGFTYSHLYNIQFLSLRFFTVFGARQRPDLAINKFIKNLYNNQPIDVYGNGDTSRDFTFVEDIVNGIVSTIGYQKSQYEIFNLGNNQTIKLIDLINTVAEVVGKKPILNFKEEQPGDVPHTWANIDKSAFCLDYQPSTSIKQGIQLQFDWQSQHLLK